VRLQLSAKKNRVLLLAPSQYIIDDVSTTFGFVMAEDVTTTVEIASLNDDEALSPSVRSTNLQINQLFCFCQPSPYPRCGPALRPVHPTRVHLRPWLRAACECFVPDDRERLGRGTQIKSDGGRAHSGWTRLAWVADGSGAYDVAGAPSQLTPKRG
jgi:hypothetical protein